MSAVAVESALFAKIGARHGRPTMESCLVPGIESWISTAKATRPPLHAGPLKADGVLVRLINRGRRRLSGANGPTSRRLGSATPLGHENSAVGRLDPRPTLNGRANRKPAAMRGGGERRKSHSGLFSLVPYCQTALPGINPPGVKAIKILGLDTLITGYRLLGCD
jgi:hypothetical protein